MVVHNNIIYTFLNGGKAKKKSEYNSIYSKHLLHAL